MKYAPYVTRDHQQLASRFRRALLYIVQALGEVGTTKLQKILYLSDLEHFNATGTTLTGARWVRYTHGPMAKALLPSTEVMDGHEIAVSHEVAGPYETRVYRLGPSPRFQPNLTSEERFALDRVLAITKGLTASDAIRLAYNTAPMLVIQKIEQTMGRIMLDAEIPFELDPDVIADAAPGAIEPQVPGRSEFKRAELARVRDLQERALAQQA